MDKTQFKREDVENLVDDHVLLDKAYEPAEREAIVNAAYRVLESYPWIPPLLYRPQDAKKEFNRLSKAAEAFCQMISGLGVSSLTALRRSSMSIDELDSLATAVRRVGAEAHKIAEDQPDPARGRRPKVLKKTFAKNCIERVFVPYRPDAVTKDNKLLIGFTEGMYALVVDALASDGLLSGDDAVVDMEHMIKNILSTQ